MLRSAKTLGIVLALQSAALFASPATLEEVMHDGLSALQRGDHQQALENLEIAVKLAPADVRPWMGLAQARRMAGDTTGADQAIERALEVSPQTGELAHVFAMFFAEGADFDRAAEFEARYARADPEAPEVFLRTASWYVAAGRPYEAAEFARSGLERGESADLYAVLGQALLQTDHSEEAEQAIRSAIRLRPYDEDLRFSLGGLLLQSGRFQAAAAAFEEARRIFDKSPRLELGMGVTLLAQESFPEAVDALLRASRLAPGLEQPLHFLSRALERAPDRAAEILLRIDAFDQARPEHYLTPFLRAKALSASLGAAASDEQLAQAETLLLKSIERKPDYWESHFELGLVRERRGRDQQAKAAVLRAIELNPRSPEPHELLASVYARLGEQALSDAAAESHRRLLRDQPQPFTSLAPDWPSSVGAPK